jgi:glutamate racemase
MNIWGRVLIIYKKYADALMNQSPAIDTVILACTHYPLLMDKLAHFPTSVQLVAQGEIVADSLRLYLKNHPKMTTAAANTRNFRFFKQMIGFILTGMLLYFIKRDSVQKEYSCKYVLPLRLKPL